MTERPKNFTGKPFLCTYTVSQHFSLRVAIIIIMVAHQLTAITDSLLPEGSALPCIALLKSSSVGMHFPTLIFHRI